MMTRKKLTRMQTICLQMVADGKTQERIAYLCGIRRATVAYHLAEARKRLGAQSTGEAIGLGVIYGLIEIRKGKDEEIPERDIEVEIIQDAVLGCDR